MKSFWTSHLSTRLSGSAAQIVPENVQAGIDDFMEYLFNVSNLVPFVLRRRPTLPDPDDERILEVAIQTGALIITHNKSDFGGVERFGIAVKTPAEFLQILRREQ